MVRKRPSARTRTVRRLSLETLEGRSLMAAGSVGVAALSGVYPFPPLAALTNTMVSPQTHAAAAFAAPPGQTPLSRGAAVAAVPGVGAAASAAGGASPLARGPNPTSVSRGVAVSAVAGVTLSVPAPGLLANTPAPDGHRLTAALVSAPSHGTLALSPDGSYTYSPAPGFVGTDFFAYSATDAAGNAPPVSALVTVTVAAPPNHTPVSRGGAATAVSGTMLSVAAPGVLAYASDPDGDRLTAALASAPSHGTLALSPDGSYTYSPAPGFVGTDSFAYTATDTAGATSAPATVTLTVAPDPRQTLEAAARAEAAAYITTQEAIDAADMAGGMMMADAQAVLNLVHFEAATSVAIQSGAWEDPNTWLGRTVPGPGARVWVMPDRTVTINSALTSAVATVRVSGTLQFDPGRDTQLAADTVVVDPAGTLLMGTKDQPIQPGVVAQMTFTGDGPIDTAWDPLMISRGLISLGKAEIYGSYVTSHLTLARPPMAGDTSLQLSAAPAGWRPGDTLVLAGTHFTGTSQTQDERLQVASIQGNAVYLTSPVRYDHDVPTQQALAAKFGQAPPGAPLTVDVGDLTRNVRFVSQNPGVLSDRGHVMFMHTQQEAVVNAGFYGLGRTDKSVPISHTNPRGRYALHFHMDGTDGAPIVVSGVAVDGSPGWGIDNHSSNVDVTDSVVYGALGAAFVSEAGDEQGSFRDDLALDSTGSPNDSPIDVRARVDIQDWGFLGHGFWLQSPTVALVDDVAAGCNSIGFVYYPTSTVDPSLDRLGVTIAENRDNTVYASRMGLYVYESKPDAPNTIIGLTAWGLEYSAFGTPYSHNVTLQGCRFVGSGGAALYLDHGSRMSYHDCYVVGYDDGLEAGYGGRNEITGGYLNNATDILIVKNINYYDASLGVRDVVVTGVTMAGGGVVMNGAVDPVVADPPFWIRYAPERIVWDGRQLYYNEQGSDQVLDAPVPALDGETNAQSLAGFGLAYAGAVTPPGATALTGLRGGVTGAAQAVGPGPLTPGPAYLKPDGSFTQVMVDPIGGEYLFKDIAAADVTTGWNLITMVDPNGVRRVGFRFA